jgi:outer membrane biosynthesis protein TonB
VTETHIGLIVTAVPALLIGGILLGRYRVVLWMYIAALVIGLGYLTTTGAIDEIGKQAMDYIPKSQPTPAAAPAAAPEAAPAAAPEPAPAPAPAPEAAPAPAPETPAPAPEAPAPEAAPAPAPEAAPAPAPDSTPAPAPAQ